MTAIIIIAIIIFIIYAASSKKKPTQQNTTYTNPNNKQNLKRKIRDELVQSLIKNIKVTVTTSSSTSKYNDDSIIDVTDQSYRINSNSNLKKIVVVSTGQTTMFILILKSIVHQVNKRSSTLFSKTAFKWRVFWFRRKHELCFHSIIWLAYWIWQS